MDYTQITTLISSVGFPIVACAAMFWNNYDQSKRHREEVKNLTDVLERNTEALLELKNKIGG